MIIVMLFKLVSDLVSKIYHFGNCPSLHDTMKMLAPPPLSLPTVWIPGRGQSQPSVGEVAGARHCSLGQRGEHQSQRGREAGGPGAGRGEVTAWLLEAGGWRLCIVQQPGGNYVEVSTLPLATCPLHLVMMGLEQELVCGHAA